MSPPTGNQTPLRPGAQRGGPGASRDSCLRCRLAVELGKSWTFKVSSETSVGNPNLFPALLIP